MGSVNRVILVGNLGRDAEVRFGGSGSAVANFSLATTEVWTGRDGDKREQTEWHRISLWGKQAESLQQYLVKGKQIYVEGRLQSRRVPKCRECDSFLPEREFRAEGSGRDVPEMKCQRCGKTSRPYLDTQVEVKADRVALLGGGAGGARGSQGAGATRSDYGEAPAREPADVPEDDIPF
jgi:single-strand DNA-binding protein